MQTAIFPVPFGVFLLFWCSGFSFFSLRAFSAELFWFLLLLMECFFSL